jgi:hypothetical protein
MKVEIKGNLCIATKEPTDPKFSGTVNAKGESRLLHHIKQELNKQGYDLIKKRMWKDGHLMDDNQQYLRTRKKGAGVADIYIYNNRWALEGAEEPFNRNGYVELAVVNNVFDKE